MVMTQHVDDVIVYLQVHFDIYTHNMLHYTPEKETGGPATI